MGIFQFIRMGLEFRNIWSENAAELAKIMKGNRKNFMEKK
jgi:hypothetical protein